MPRKPKATPASQVDPASALPSLNAEASSSAIAAARAELVAQGWTPPHDNQADASYEVVVDRRDLWDSLRAAHREGQSCGRLIGTESWNKASDYANVTVLGWGTMRRVPADHVGVAVKWAVTELLGALPEQHDWLNPEAERTLRKAAGL